MNVHVRLAALLLMCAVTTLLIVEFRVGTSAYDPDAPLEGEGESMARMAPSRASEARGVSRSGASPRYLLDVNQASVGEFTVGHTSSAEYSVFAQPIPLPPTLPPGGAMPDIPFGDPPAWVFAPPTGIAVHWRERDYAAGDHEYQHEYYVYDAGFEVVQIFGRTQDDMFVLGRGASDPPVYSLERWVFSVVSGGYSATKPLAGTGIGTSYTDLIRTSIAVHNGAYIPPDQRGAVRAHRVYRLFTWPSGVAVGAASVDPDGRFVIYREGDSFKRLLLSGFNAASLEPGVFLDLASLQSSAATNLVAFQFRQDAVNGRVWTSGAYSGGAPVGDYRIVCFDPNNDGVLDACIETDMDGVAQLAPAGIPVELWF